MKNFAMMMHPFYWPPRSPDLTPLDFFLWGHVKTIVYATNPRSLEDLKAKIANVISGITINQLFFVNCFS